MVEEHVLVGCLSLALGLVALFAAVSNWDFYYRLDKIRWIERCWGRSVARWSYSLLAVLLVSLGLLIASGWTMHGWK